MSCLWSQLSRVPFVHPCLSHSPMPEGLAHYRNKLKMLNDKKSWAMMQPTENRKKWIVRSHVCLHHLSIVGMDWLMPTSYGGFCSIIAYRLMWGVVTWNMLVQVLECVFWVQGKLKTNLHCDESVTRHVTSSWGFQYRLQLNTWAELVESTLKGLSSLSITHRITSHSGY